MKKSLALWVLAGLTFTAVLGTLLHFLYGWTDSASVAPFSAVNESTWEHMKILFFPMLIFACIQWAFFREDYAGFWWIQLIGIAVGVMGIPVLFYTYNGAFGKSPDWLNVLFFFIAAAGAYALEWWLLKKDFYRPRAYIAVVVLCALAIVFVLFTFYPPRLPLFQDPITEKYGVVFL
ncbi:MAG: hypothetical protein J6S04_00005 [Clostridia bacterium]|nr:hypothetical protein [Clostridia bacterium]